MSKNTAAGNGRKVPVPNFVQVPNAFLDLVPDMSEAEMKVMAVAIRAIMGRRKYGDGPEPMSKGWFMKRTGMSKNGVANGIREACQRGWLILVDYGGPRGSARYYFNYHLDNDHITRK